MVVTEDCSSFMPCVRAYLLADDLTADLFM